MLRRLLLISILLSIFVCSQAMAAKVDGLVMYLSFDEGAGDTAKDYSGNGNSGKITKAKWANGKFGKALEFDGSASVEVASSDSLEAMKTEITVLAWINPTLTGSAWQGVVTKGADGVEHFELLINTDAHIHTAWMFKQGRVVGDRAGKILTAGKWSYLAVTFKPKEWIFYHNGELVENNKGADSELLPDGKPVVIGDEKGMSRFFTGIIDEVAIFNKAISEADVNEYMNIGLTKVLSVESVGKLSATWADLKTR
jgi:hypothetical protein